MNLQSHKHSETAGRREREKLRRAQDILSAAERVFAIHGFDAATMEQIAQAAQYATGTIYLYFKDKHALYAALIASKLSSMVDQVEKAAQAAAPADPANRLRNAIRSQFEFHDHNREFFEVLMRHHRGPPPAGTRDWKLIGQTIKRHHVILVDLIEQSQRRKLIRKGDSVDFATALLGMVIHLTHVAMKDGKQPLVGRSEEHTSELQ